MSPTATPATDIRATIDQLLQLPPEQRLEIGERLLESVADNDVAEAWDQEIARRLALLESGQAKTIPASEVMAEMRALIHEAD